MKLCWAFIDARTVFSRADTTQSDHELLNKHLELEANSEEKQPEYQARPEQSEQ